MNASAAARHTGRRAARFNFWAAIAVAAALTVFAVKAQTAREQHAEVEVACSPQAKVIWSMCRETSP